uniref:DEUBAD domain-containing protein n=1 Tax=Kalanchoe fedtschenkoi TaxID=63787 RepID=A0A7N0UBH3_KALFE
MVVEKKSVDVVTYDHGGNGGENLLCGGGTELLLPSVVRDCDEKVEKKEREEEKGEEFIDVDSGAESDHFDMLEMGDFGAEFCLVEDQTCSIPLELYDLPDLSDVLSLDVWNDCLSDEDRFNLAKYLPYMDEVTYMWTLKELLSGGDFHFGSPVHRLFEMMKGGLCEPRVALYHQGLNMLQKCTHYHQIRNHHNSMVSSFHQIIDIWGTYRGCSIEEKLYRLNIMRSRRTLMYEKMEDTGLDRASSGRDAHEVDIWSQTLMETRVRQKKGSQFGYEAVCSHSHGNQKQKALLKFVEPMSPAKPPAGYPPVQCGSSSTFPRHDKKARCGTNLVIGEREEAEEAIYNAVKHREKDGLIGNLPEIHKSGTRHGRLRKDEFSDQMGTIPLLLNNHKFVNDDRHQVNQLSDIKVLTSKPSGGGAFNDFGKKLNYFGNIHSFTREYRTSGKGNKRFPQSGHLDNQVGMLDPSGLFWQSNQGEMFMRNQLAQDNWDTQSKRPQMRQDSLDLNMNSYSASLSQTNDEAPLSIHQAKFSAEYMGGNCVQNGAPDLTALRVIRSISPSDETESDSSKHVDEQSNPLWNRGSDSGDLHRKNAKSLMMKKKSEKGDLGEAAHLETQITESCSLKGKRKSSVDKLDPLTSTSFRITEEERVCEKTASNKKDLKRKKIILGKTRNLLKEFVERSTALKSYSVGKERNAESLCDLSANLWNHLNERDVDENDLLQSDVLADGRKGQQRSEIEIQPGNEHGKSNSRISGSIPAAKKQKRKENGIHMEPQSECDHVPPDFLQKVNAVLVPKQEYVWETETGSHVLGTFDPQCSEMELTDVELEAKTQKTPYTLITPTVHTELPFSVIHLLSAVRITLMSPLPEDTVAVSQPLEKGIAQVVGNAENQGTAGDVSCNENAENNNSVPQVHANAPTLTVQEIVNRVRSNPGDPCILETHEQLQALVKGVLKIFSSKKAPLGAKDWKPLAAYKKSTRSWYWTGPVSQSSSSDNETIEEVTSPEAWGLPRRMLVKVVDSFANWLKSSQEFLQQLGSLPAPPESLFQFTLEEKDRFKDQRAQKSACTFEPSSAEVRDYFRLEEALRYSIPDRVFAYTAADGSKSMVAPLRRCGGKPTSKPRDHYLLKPDRPPHVTILCVVRDAASRLPGCIGTRSDICTLMRDSQYIVEQVLDAQLNQIVSGALDRLRYEHDPCVHFDNDRKIWVYLHKERTEEDFEDDGTSSTRRWRRQKKDPSQPPDQGSAPATEPVADELFGLETTAGAVPDGEEDADEQMGLDTITAPDQDVEELPVPAYEDVDEEDIIVDIM